MRLALVLVLAACGGGGGDAALPPAPVSPNPAPELAPIESIPMGGDWRVASNTLLVGNDPDPDLLPVGSIVRVTAFSGFAAQLLILPGVPASGLAREDIEDQIGFDVDWYENVGDGFTLDYGYGWDVLETSAGVAGGVHDYMQYGVRLVAPSDDVMIGHEAMIRQTRFGEPRGEWVSAIVLERL